MVYPKYCTSSMLKLHVPNSHISQRSNSTTQLSREADMKTLDNPATVENTETVLIAYYISSTHLCTILSI